jgi:hypothetical protein
MERTQRGVLAVVFCLGMLICIYGYDTEKMLSFRLWAALFVVATTGYIMFLVINYFKERKVS